MSRRVLLIGYGNPGRMDDGLGPALAGAIERLALPGVTVDADYQLAVEDAAAAAQQDAVIFADASVSGREPFELRRVEPADALSFTTHSVEPGAVMAMARDLFGAQTKGYSLGIRGYRFNEFGETLSGRARQNLEAAARFLEGVLRHDLLEEAVEDNQSRHAVPQGSGISHGDPHKSEAQP